MAKDTNRYRFFQFPVSMLRVEKRVDQVTRDEQVRHMQQMVNYCIGDTMEKLAADRDTKDLIPWADAELSNQPAFGDSDALGDDTVIALAAMRTLGVVAESKAIMAAAVRSKGSVDACSHGRTQCRVASALFWQAMDDWTWREFAVLCAVNAAVGRDKFKFVTLDRLSAITLGASGATERDRLKLGRFSLTERQLRYSLNKLHGMGLFQKLSPNRRRWYYSTTLTEAQLGDALCDRAAKTKRLSPAAASKALQDRIRNAR